MKLSNKQINIIFSIIVAVGVLSTAVVVVFLHRDDKKTDAKPVDAETTVAYAHSDGIYFENGNWVYYENNKLSDKTDFVSATLDGESALWYVKDGKVDFEYNALIKKDADKWFYVEDGKVVEESDSTVALRISKLNKDKTSDNEFSLHKKSEMPENAKTQLLKAVETVENRGYDVGFYVIDLNTLKGFSYNADKEFYSASTIKGPYVVSAVESDFNIFNEENRQIDSILKYSSNEAYISLRNKYGDECFENFAIDAGSDLIVDKNDDFQFITPRQLADLWFKSYVFFESGDVGNKLGGMFENPETSPIHSALSQKYRTSSKAGWVSSGNIDVTNDAGIIYAGEKTYLISVMTTAPCNFSLVETLVKEIDIAYYSLR